MALIVATLLLFAAGPFILWPLIRTPPDDEASRNQMATSPPGGEDGRPRRPDGAAE
jgi:hypothetical protein